MNLTPLKRTKPEVPYERPNQTGSYVVEKWLPTAQGGIALFKKKVYLCDGLGTAKQEITAIAGRYRSVVIESDRSALVVRANSVEWLSGSRLRLRSTLDLPGLDGTPQVLTCGDRVAVHGTCNGVPFLTVWNRKENQTIRIAPGASGHLHLTRDQIYLVGNTHIYGFPCDLEKREAYQLQGPPHATLWLGQRLLYACGEELVVLNVEERTEQRWGIRADHLLVTDSANGFVAVDGDSLKFYNQDLEEMCSCRAPSGIETATEAYREGNKLVIMSPQGYAMYRLSNEGAGN